MRYADLSIINTILVSPEATCGDVSDFFKKYAQAPLCPIGADQNVSHVIRRNAFLSKLNNQFGYSLYSNKPAIKFFEKPSAQCEYADDISHLFACESIEISDISDGVIINREGLYFGIVSGIELLKSIGLENANLVRSLKAEIVSRRTAEEQIRLLANADPLTGLLNRRAFMEMVHNRISKGEHLTCAFMDLDRFKQVNDQFGHAVGDAVLREIAGRLLRNSDIDLEARFGGDEFAFVMEASGNPRNAKSMLEAVWRSIREPIRLEQGLVHVGASIGFAEFGTDATDFSTLLHAADLAMLRIKASGGGVERYNSQRDLADLSLFELERKLSCAIDAEDIKPALQPIVDVRTRGIIGYELLARWTDNHISPAPAPSAFIPVAEKLGLLNRLLWGTLDQALRTISLDNIYLSINISPSQLTDPNWFIGLLSLLERHATRPSSIQIEITENVLFRNLEDGARVLKNAHKLGFRIALDDFGTGYSSLYLLHHLPLDTIKIDKSFLSSDRDEAIRKKVLRSLIALCRELGVTSCMEGIEGQDMMDLIADLGYDQAQGYFLGRPEIIVPTANRKRA